MILIYYNFAVNWFVHTSDILACLDLRVDWVT